jgi:hypothetical protein
VDGRCQFGVSGRTPTVMTKGFRGFPPSLYAHACSDMISKGFGLVAFFSSVKASYVCIHLSCLVCIQSVVRGVRSRLFCGHEGSPFRNSNYEFLLQISRLQLPIWETCLFVMDNFVFPQFSINNHPVI